MKLRRLVLIILFLPVTAEVANATSLSWIPSGSGLFWSAPGNWFGAFPAAAPGNNDTANFGPTVTTVTINSAPPAIQALTTSPGIGTGHITLESSTGNPFTLNVTSATGTQDVTLANTPLTLGTSGKPVNLNVGDDLTVQSTAALNVKFASNVSTQDVFVPDNAEIVVDGVGSTLNASGAVTLGTTGFAGRMTFRNGADGQVENIAVGASNSTPAGGVLNVESNADVLTSTNMFIAGGSASAGNVNIEGNGSTVTQSGARFVAVAGSGGPGSLNIGTVSSGAALTTGTGGMGINPLGTVNVGSATTTGSLFVNGDLSVGGGQLNIFDGSNCSLAGDFSIHSHGSATVPDFTMGIGNALNLSSGGSLTLRGGLFISGGSIEAVEATSITANSTNPNALSKWGESSSADVEFAGNSTGSFLGGLQIGGLGAQTRSVKIGSLSTVNTGNLTITGAGTTVSLNSQGSLIVAPGKTTTLSDGATLNIDGGNAVLQTLSWQAGSPLHFNSGSLSLVGDLFITPGGGSVLGEESSLVDRHLTITGTTYLLSFSTLVLDGGTLSTGNIFIDTGSAFQFKSGTLGITGAGTNLAFDIVTNNLTDVINIGANNISLGSTASFTGFQNQGKLNVGANTVNLNSASYARLGSLATLEGGTINAANGIALGTGANVVGRGTVNARITAEAGSLIEATGALAIGAATSPAGFNFGGELRTKQFTVTLNSSAQATLGNLTVLGNGSSAGTLTAANGVVVDFGDAVTGVGTISSTNTFAKRNIINGVVQGNSSSQRITFSGYVVGAGSFSNVNFSGTFSPGFSPTTVVAGNIGFSNTSTLVMEIGGTTPGSDYDFIQSSAQFTADGTLQVLLIDGFMPAAGDSFNLFDFTSLTGIFDTITLPALAAGLSWNSSQLYSAGIFSVIAGLPGDFNNDGRVDSRDYVVWRKFNGTSHVLANDPDPLPIDSDQYATWRQNYGRSTGGFGGDSENGEVPEPATLLLLLTAVAAAPRRR